MYRDLLLAYMNSIQALYYLPSLGQQVSFSLVRLEIQKTEPANMPTYEGERKVYIMLWDNLYWLIIKKSVYAPVFRNFSKKHRILSEEPKTLPYPVGDILCHNKSQGYAIQFF
jgi:hypothetical protein